MNTQLNALHASVRRLTGIVAPLDDTTITQSAYPAEWTIAQVMSHLGSGAVIFERRLDDLLAGTDTPDDFAPATWDDWNAKTPRAQVDNGLAADAALLSRLDATTEDERSTFSFPMGPMNFDFDGFVGLRLNEHAFHTWDVEVAIDPTATLPRAVTDLVIDNLELIARYTAKPTGHPRAITIRTIEPNRSFTLDITRDGAVLVPSPTPAVSPDLEMSAEGFARLVYGRLDLDHTPAVTGDRAMIDLLRKTFPGP